MGTIPFSCPHIDKAVAELELAQDQLVDVYRRLSNPDNVPLADLRWSVEYVQDRIRDALEHFEGAREINAMLRERIAGLEAELAAVEV